MPDFAAETRLPVSLLLSCQIHRAQTLKQLNVTVRPRISTPGPIHYCSYHEYANCCYT